MAIHQNKNTPNQKFGQGLKTDDKNNVTHKVGDAIEQVGKKVRDLGADKLGSAIYKTGDKIEHLKDKK